MEPELFYLVLSVGLCGTLWIPTVIERVIRIGLTETVGNNPDTKDLPGWVERLKRTHRNLVDNIVIFGTLVLILQSVEKSNDTTGLAALIFFYARLIQTISHIFGIVWVRTVSFVIGWLATAVIFLVLI